jgi:Na+-translocating ferredoxin:NAD+ oxidoreductase subunit C
VLHEIMETVRETFMGWKRPVFRLNTETLPIIDLARPKELCFPRSAIPVGGGSPKVGVGDEVAPGQVLWSEAGVVLACPVQGKVSSIGMAPNLRGGASGPSICIEPAEGDTPAAWPGLDPASASVDQLVERLLAAGLLSREPDPRPLLTLLRPKAGLDALVVAAIDKEPGVCSSLQLWRENTASSVAAAALLGRIAGAPKTLIAVPEAMRGEAEAAAKAAGVGVLGVPTVYPESLPALLALRAGAAGRVPVVSLEAALDALYAVRDGLATATRCVTVIGPDREALGNWRVPLGTRIGDVLAAAGLAPADHDKIVAGGPMRGFAQYTTETVLDAGVDAVVLVPQAGVVPFTTEACVNCGTCIDACPLNLQVQLLGRYAEFGLFDATEEYDIHQCIECGLCAAVCTARRPLVQYLKLAKKELRKARIERAAAAPPAESAAQEEAS